MTTKHSNWRDDLREVVDSDSEDQNDNEIKKKKLIFGRLVKENVKIVIVRGVEMME